MEGEVGGNISLNPHEVDMHGTLENYLQCSEV